MPNETNEGPGRITFADDETRGAHIKVVGVGGGGGNAISRMIASGPGWKASPKSTLGGVR